MATRIMGPTGSKRRKRFLLVPVLLLALAGLYLTMGAQAVNNTGAFELDGNAVNGAAAGDDWDNVCHQVTAGGFDSAGHDLGGALCTSASNTSGATAVSWTDATKGLEIYTGGGSKDFNDPEDSWLWKPKDTVPDKDTILHSFAARYSLTPTSASGTCPSTGTTCEVIFFGSDRFANDGDSQLGFWFFQNKVQTTGTASNGGFKFSGHHKAGDLLIISDFSNGGTTSTIKAYLWDPTCTKADSGSEDAVPVGGCPAKNLRLQGKSTAANCTTSAQNSSFCGIVNGSDGTTAPWPFLDKTNHTNYQQGELYEAGVNLSKLGIGTECFSSVLAESRSSDSTASVLKDFVLSNFGACDTSLSTTPKDGAGAAIPAGGLSITTAGNRLVKDSANLTVNGAATWSGTLKFYLCGPIASGTCTAGSDPAKPNGVLISTHSVNQSTANLNAFLSDAAKITSAGRYCWRANFIHITEGVPDAKDDSATECFTVNPVTPTLSTEAVDASGNPITSVPFGNKIYDKATLGGTAPKPGTDGPGDANGQYKSIYLASATPTQAAAGGSINFKVYGPSSTGTPTTTVCNTLAAGFASAGISVSVSGNGTYGGANATPPPPSVEYDASASGAGGPGFYFWKAAYTSDNVNNTAAPLDASGNATQHNLNCDQNGPTNNERVEVQQIPSTIATRQYFFPQDKVSIGLSGSPTGDLANLDGTVTFKLFGPTGGDTPQTAAQNCAANSDTVGTGGLLYKSAALTVSGAAPQTKTTSNDSARVDANTTVVWRVTYVSNKAAHLGSVSECTESTTASFAGNDTNISLP
jgi:hypothetical protein